MRQLGWSKDDLLIDSGKYKSVLPLVMALALISKN